ncbi:thermonuclease family protein [Ensifer sp. HO-A22]|uniref:Thermonuclease family protein n=1 Tax=Ensifer oleiphilus TaxID=2742698 RepID=A0A7Y6Q2J6_9HYPH|nr:thermonuclease family protein [Ensifer oleiphilus]NVD37675.1 thermonuclease family protein [Ensifer oleiphilus]
MRQQLVSLAGGIAALALYTGILYAGAATIRDRESSATPDFVLETPEMGEAEPTAEAEDVPFDMTDPQASDTTPDAGGQGESGSRSAETAARAIEPQQFGLPDKVTTKPLERIEPRQPLSNTSKDKPKAPTILQQPVALAAGLIRFDKLTLQLDGIEAEAAERTCESGGKTWPCGMVARTAFRNFLRARAVSCDIPDDGTGDTVTAHCTVGGQDPAAWLVANGWATPLSGSALEEQAEAARKAKLGFYGDDPRDFRQTPMPFDDPSAAATMDEPAPDL